MTAPVQRLHTIGQELGMPEETLGQSCHGHMDGECFWRHCPQLRDGEPAKSGRHCPLDIEDDE